MPTGDHYVDDHNNDDEHEHHYLLDVELDQLVDEHDGSYAVEPGHHAEAVIVAQRQAEADRAQAARQGFEAQLDQASVQAELDEAAWFGRGAYGF